MASYIAGNRSVCTPITSMSGRSALAAVTMPETRPPPPTAITRHSSPAILQHFQRDGPCPAATASSS